MNGDQRFFIYKICCPVMEQTEQRGVFKAFLYYETHLLMCVCNSDG